MLRKGNVVLVPFPFTDLTQTKIRPAVVLWDHGIEADILLCFITSKVSSTVSAFELLIAAGEAEFAATGLRTSSRVRVMRMATVERQLVLRRLGRLEPQLLQELNGIPRQALQLL